MTFESLVNNVAVNEEALAVKVSYGAEIRRITFNGTAYIALRDICAQLFALEPANTVLKYQDSDDDKITVSSDAEVQEALRAAKEKKILRLFVEVKAAPVPPAEERPAEAFPCGGGWRRWGPMYGRGGFPHRGGMHGGFRGGMMHGGFQGHHAFPHSPAPFTRPPFPGHFGASFDPSSSPSATPVASEHVPRDPNCNNNTQGQSANFNVPTYAHGIFSPAQGSSPYPHHHPHSSPRASPYARCEMKEHKRAMKEQIRILKENATTEEDRKAIKEMKEEMRAECKAKWQDSKFEKKAWKSEEKAQWKEWKAERKAEKAQWKQEKKGEKKGEKKERKCEKDGRFMAKHVADVTIPDNSELPADTPVTKTWRLRNAGILAWPADSQLLFVSRRGDNLNGPERVFVGEVAPQEEVEVSLTFITPSEPGRYIGYYRMASGDGSKFGQRVWVSFIIPAAAPMPTDASAVPLLLPVVAPSAPLLPLSASPLYPQVPLAKANAGSNDMSLD